MADKKIDYREVASNSLIARGFSLGPVYNSLIVRTDAEINERLSEILEALELVDRDTARTQRRASSQEAKRKTNQILRKEKVDRSYFTRRCK